jgi:hypothetical protein
LASSAPVCLASASSLSESSPSCSAALCIQTIDTMSTIAIAIATSEAISLSTDQENH